MPDADLQTMLQSGKACGIDADLSMIDGAPALRLTLDKTRRAGTLGRDFGDEPTFQLLADQLSDGTIEVDLRARLLPDAPDYARGFIGLAYRVQDDLRSFESLYLRPLNGRPHAPPPPRDRRAVQYFAYPDWKFDRLRDAAPDQFEAAADISLDRWHQLRLDITGRHLLASVDGMPVLDLNRTLIPPLSGRVGLWVDIGTEGWFRSLRVTQA